MSRPGIRAFSQMRNPSGVASTRRRLGSSGSRERLTMNRSGSSPLSNESRAVSENHVRGRFACLEQDRLNWFRHCEERSDEAIQGGAARPWIASLRSQGRSFFKAKPITPQREMGPTLRSTPLSPACGPRRALDAWRLDAGSDRPLRATEGRLLIARRSRRRRFRRGPGSIARTCPYRPAVPRPFRRPGLQAVFAGTEVLRIPRLRPAIRPSDFAPSRYQRSGIWLAPGRTFVLSSSHSSTERHLAVVSLRFQNPFSVAGLSAFVSEGPIPVSMIGRCARQPIRASAGPSSYPLSA